MTAIHAMDITKEELCKKDSIDPRVIAVIDEIGDSETYSRIADNMWFGLDTVDDLLIAGWLNFRYPPADQYDVAECLSHGVFTVIFNPTTRALEWESNSARYDAAVEWLKRDNPIRFNPPERVLLVAMTFDGNNIRFVENPTEEMKLAAVRRTSSAIEHIKYPSDAVRRAAATTAIAETA